MRANAYDSKRMRLDGGTVNKRLASQEQERFGSEKVPDSQSFDRDHHKDPPIHTLYPVGPTVGRKYLMGPTG